MLNSQLEPVGVTTPMDANSLEARVKNIDERTTKIEQILPTLATKEDLKALATKDELRAEGQATRQHFNAVAERIEASVKAIAEGHEATKAFVEAQLTQVDKKLTAHDRRIMKLEAESLKRR